MAFYRNTIWLKHKPPSQGIKYYDNGKIDAATNILRVKARESYSDNVVDVEAVMLSNKSAILKFFRKNRGKLWTIKSFLTLQMSQQRKESGRLNWVRENKS